MAAWVEEGGRECTLTVAFIGRVPCNFWENPLSGQDIKFPSIIKEQSVRMRAWLLLSIFEVTQDAWWSFLTSFAVRNVKSKWTRFSALIELCVCEIFRWFKLLQSDHYCTGEFSTYSKLPTSVWMRFVTFFFPLYFILWTPIKRSKRKMASLKWWIEKWAWYNNWRSVIQV